MDDLIVARLQQMGMSKPKAKAKSKSKSAAKIKEELVMKMMKLQGGGKWSNLFDKLTGVKNVGRKIKNSYKKYVKPSINKAKSKVKGELKKLVGLGKAKVKRKVSPKMKKRGEMVKKLMKKGMSLPEASHFIKVNNLL